MTAAERKTRLIDWEKVESLYRAGVASVRSIAGEHGLTEGGIRKRAHKLGWLRDLTVRVQERARAELVRNSVRAKSSDSDAAVVADAATTIVSIVQRHRADIFRSRNHVEALLEHLAEAYTKRTQIESHIVNDTPAAEDAQRRAAMLRAVALPAQANTLRSLISSLDKLVSMERQAYNIDAGTAIEPPGIESSSSSEDVEAQLLQDLRALRANPGARV